MTVDGMACCTHAADDTDYNVTPSYPNKTPPDAQEAAMEASKAPHPSGEGTVSQVSGPVGCQPPCHDGMWIGMCHRQHFSD